MDKDVRLQWKLPERPECFFGREEEIQQLQDYFDNGNKVVVVQGIGGIGKTGLVSQFALKYRDQYETITFANCITNIQSLVVSDVELPLENLNRNMMDDVFFEPEEEYFEKKMAYLKQTVSEKNLIIIDNYNCDQDPYLAEFLDLGCRILISTRKSWEERGISVPVLCLGPVSNKEKIKMIFEHYYLPKDQIEEDSIPQLIDLLRGHTLAVELVAKQLNEKKIDVLDLVQIFTKNEDIVNTKKLDYELVTKIFAQVFRVRELDEEEKRVLRFLCFVPYTGISKELLVKYGKRGTHTAILKLLGSSWLKQIELDIVCIHPIVVDMVITELDPNWNNTSIFMENMAKDFMDDDISIYRLEPMLVIAENALKMMGVEDVGCIKMLIAISHTFYKRYRKYGIAIGMLQHALQLQDRQLEETRSKIVICRQQEKESTMYQSLSKKLMEQEEKRCMIQHQIGEIYFLSEKYEDALHTFMKLSKNSTVDVYCDIAKVYAKVNEFKKAIEYVQAGLKMKRTKYGLDEIPLVDSYLMLGDICNKQGDVRMAKHWLDEALRIAESQMKVQQKCEFYAQYAAKLQDMKHYAEALEYHQKTCILSRKVYGEMHVFVVHAYAEMAKDYYALEDYVSALQCSLRELQLRKKMRRVKTRLYVGVTRLVSMVNVDALPKETQEDLKEFTSDFNRLLKENPQQGFEMLKQ